MHGSLRVTNNGMDTLKYILFISFCGLNVFLIYVVAHSPYHMFLNQLEYSHVDYKTRELISRVLTVSHILILFASVLVPFVNIWRTKRVELFPVFAGSLTILFLIWFSQENYYPDGIREYSKDGYRYRIETWYLDGENKYKRWKSSHPDNGKSYHEIEWTLDSTGLHH